MIDKTGTTVTTQVQSSKVHGSRLQRMGIELVEILRHGNDT